MLEYFISFDTAALRVHIVSLYSEAAEGSFLKKQEVTTLFLQFRLKNEHYFKVNIMS